MADDGKQKLQLDYPCPWVYKIIGPDEEALHRAVSEVVRDRTCKVSLSRTSEEGKYHCLNVELSVESEGHRQDVYEQLKCHPAVKIVL